MYLLLVPGINITKKKFTLHLHTCYIVFLSIESHKSSADRRVALFSICVVALDASALKSNAHTKIRVCVGKPLAAQHYTN